MKQFFTKYVYGFLGILIFIALLYNVVNEDRKQKLLNHSRIVIGILEREDHSSIKFINGDFNYWVKNKKFSICQKGDFSFMKKGDTVLIEYALRDPSVARVKDRYYMKKYHYLRNQ
jgi:DUF1680 family protein